MREIRLNAFEMNCVGHQSPGLWAYPRDRSVNYTDLDYWTGLARTLERGKFDGIFLADVLGIYDVYGGSPDAALRHAVQVPVNDPVLLIPAMAQVTEHLGFGVTSTLSYEPPSPFARRNAPRSCTRPARRGAAAPLPRRMPNACSSTARAKRSWRHRSPISAAAPPGLAATPPTS